MVCRSCYLLCGPARWVVFCPSRPFSSSLPRPSNHPPGVVTLTHHLVCEISHSILGSPFFCHGSHLLDGRFHLYMCCRPSVPITGHLPSFCAPPILCRRLPFPSTSTTTQHTCPLGPFPPHLPRQPPHTTSPPPALPTGRAHTPTAWWISLRACHTCLPDTWTDTLSSPPTAPSLPAFNYFPPPHPSPLHWPPTLIPEPPLGRRSGPHCPPPPCLGYTLLLVPHTILLPGYIPPHGLWSLGPAHSCPTSVPTTTTLPSQGHSTSTTWACIHMEVVSLLSSSHIPSTSHPRHTTLGIPMHTAHTPFSTFPTHPHTYAPFPHHLCPSLPLHPPLFGHGHGAGRAEDTRQQFPGLPVRVALPPPRALPHTHHSACHLGSRLVHTPAHTAGRTRCQQRRRSPSLWRYARPVAYAASPAPPKTCAARRLRMLRRR